VKLVGFPTMIGGRVTGERADPAGSWCDFQRKNVWMYRTGTIFAKILARPQKQSMCRILRDAARCGAVFSGNARISAHSSRRKPARSSFALLTTRVLMGDNVFACSVSRAHHREKRPARWCVSSDSQKVAMNRCIRQPADCTETH
jgi:hypothetical protein